MLVAILLLARCKQVCKYPLLRSAAKLVVAVACRKNCTVLRHALIDTTMCIQMQVVACSTAQMQYGSC